MSDKRFIVDDPTDESRVIIDTNTGEELIKMTHDDDGWHGFDRLEQFVNILNRVA